VTDPAPLLTQPGQHIIRHETAASEVRVPVQQLARWIAVNVTLALVITAAICVGLWGARVPLGLVWRRWVVAVWSVGWCWWAIVRPLRVLDKRYSIEVIDQSWPATRLPMPAHVGPLDARGIRDRVWEDALPPEPEPTDRAAIEGQMREVIQVEVTHQDERGHTQRMTRDVLPVSPDKARALAEHILGGGEFSERALTSRNVLSSRDEVNAIREVMIDAGWAHWRDQDEPRQGVAVSPAGRAVLRAIAEEA